MSRTDAQLTPAEIAIIESLEPIWSANQQIRVNAWATSLEYFTPSGGAGDMVLASAQTNSGLKTFLDATFWLRNVANTFTSLFTNVATAARTWTLPDSNTIIPIISQLLTFSWPTAARTITLPDANFTVARIDAANTFTGIQTFSTPIAAWSVATMTATVWGWVPTPPNNTTTFLRGDGTFATPSGCSSTNIFQIRSTL